MPETSVRQACMEYGVAAKSLEDVGNDAGEYALSLVKAYFGMDFGDNNCPSCDHANFRHIVGITADEFPKLWFVSCNLCATDRSQEQVLCFDNGRGPYAG